MKETEYLFQNTQGYYFIIKNIEDGLFTKTLRTQNSECVDSLVHNKNFNRTQPLESYLKDFEALIEAPEINPCVLDMHSVLFT